MPIAFTRDFLCACMFVFFYFRHIYRRTDIRTISLILQKSGEKEVKKVDRHLSGFRWMSDGSFRRQCPDALIFFFLSLYLSSFLLSLFFKLFLSSSIIDGGIYISP